MSDQVLRIKARDVTRVFAMSMGLATPGVHDLVPPEMRPTALFGLTVGCTDVSCDRCQKAVHCVAPWEVIARFHGTLQAWLDILPAELAERYNAACDKAYRESTGQTAEMLKSTGNAPDSPIGGDDA